MPHDAPGLRVLGTSDVAGIEISPAEVVEVVASAYRALADGVSDNPRKLTVKPRDGHSVAYAMLARDGAREVVAVKTSYKHDPAHDRATQHYYTTLTLYDDRTGLPIAMMDCSRIGSLRTPAVSALIAKACAVPDSRSVLVIGTGTQGRQALPFLLATMPGLERLMLYGTHAQGIAAVRENLRRHHPGRDVEVVTDLRSAAGEADIVLAVAGAGTRAAVEHEWLAPHALSILVGHGVAPSTLADADLVVATSAAQMAVTGTDMADTEGKLRPVDVELPEILAGRATGRRSATERVFAYNSGLVITDIALGCRFAELAIADGLGKEVPLWA
jgi:ornithine cyclodeaminase